MDNPLKAQLKTDLHDSEKDIREMKGTETTIDLPDVEDIPGQEHVTVPDFKEFADTTISSDGEEGTGLFGDSLTDDDGNVSPLERTLLHKSSVQSPDPEELDVEAMSLDNTDNEGAPLNEGNLLTDRFGEDLDLPESEEVDEEDD